MESYTRLSDGGRSPSTEPAFNPPFSSEYDQRPTSKLRAWWAQRIGGPPAKQNPVSGYLTLIPLSGKPAAQLILGLGYVKFWTCAAAFSPAANEC